MQSFWTSIYGFYWCTREKLKSPRQTVDRGARKRLETWLHLTKCVGWAYREFIPEGTLLLNRASTFLVGLGRV